MEYKKFTNDERRAFYNNAVNEHCYQLKTPPKDYVMFDIETNGRDIIFSEVMELGAVRVIDNVPVEQYSSLIKIQGNVSRDIALLTGITKNMLNKEGIPRNTAYHEFWDFTKNPSYDKKSPDSMKHLPLVGHNIKAFDLRFILRDIYQLSPKDVNGHKSFVEVDYFDTLPYARETISTDKYKLQELAKKFEVSTETAHRALDDAMTNFFVYEVLRNMDNKIYDKEEKSNHIEYEQLSLF